MRINHALVALALVVPVVVASACAADRPTDPAPAVSATTASEDAILARRYQEREEAARKRIEALPRVPAAPTAAEPAMPAAEKLEPIKADAAARAGVGGASVQVVSSERVSWSDGSMGCPVPGELYTQMLTSGYRVLVAAGTETLDYRLADSGFFKLCPSSAPLEPLPGSGRSDR